MYGVTLLIAAAALGVDYGWQPVEGESLEYIIQIEPDLVAALEAGEAITSEIPAEVAGVRRFRIQIGEAALPQVDADPLAGGAAAGTGQPTPAQPPVMHPPVTQPATTQPSAPQVAAEQPPLIPPPPASGDTGSIYGDGTSAGVAEGSGSQYGDTGSMYGDTGTGGGFEAPRSVEPPPASGSGGDLFSGSGSLFPSGGDRVADGSGGTPAPPATLPPSSEEEGPSLSQPLLEPPTRDTTQPQVAQPATQPPTLPEPGPSPFRQPELLTPPEPAGELTGFDAEEEADHEGHAHEDDSHETEASTSHPTRTQTEPRASEPAAEAETARPWVPLILTLLVLFASLGGNVYLGWILVETLARYRRLQTERAG